MDQAAYLDLGQKYVMRNVGRLPLVFSRGQGSRLWDADGKEYIDFLTGISVHNFGHSHPEYVKAFTEQAGKITHVSNYFYLEEQVELARRLLELSGFARVFFGNSGAEANEAAIKLARKYGKLKRGGRTGIVTAENSFHGRTMGALAATGQPKYQESFRPLPAGFTYAEYNNLAAWEKAVTDDTCAVLVEPVLGEGGVVPATPDFLQGLARLCRDRDLLLMVDEVQTGLGRTGAYFAFEHYGIRPDVMTLAKSLGGGVPCGALLVNEKADIFTPGDHSTTVGGGGMAFAAGLVTLRLLQQPGLLKEINRKGELVKKTWQSWMEELPAVSGFRGLGLMLALTLKVPSKEVMLACLAEGLIVNAVQEKAIRILPAFNIPDQELEAGLTKLHQVLRRFSG